MKNIPKVIYLQTGDEDIRPDEDFNKLSEVSWCADKIFPTDIEYVLKPEPMNDEQLMKLALANSCTPYGKADPGTYAFIAGYKAALAQRLPNFHKVIANTPPEVKAEVIKMMDDLDKENRPSLLFHCQSAREGHVHCLTICDTCKPPKEDNEALLFAEWIIKRDDWAMIEGNFDWARTTEDLYEIFKNK